MQSVICILVQQDLWGILDYGPRYSPSFCFRYVGAWPKKACLVLEQPTPFDTTMLDSTEKLTRKKRRQALLLACLPVPRRRMSVSESRSALTTQSNQA